MKPGRTTRDKGRCSVHEETEIYYIIENEGDVVLDDVRVQVKAEDIIIIPDGTWHWIDNSKSDKPFWLFTLWTKQEQNGVFHKRLKAWGISVKYIDGDYTEGRIGEKITVGKERHQG